MQETLLNPPFAKDPPYKFNVSAKTLGLICAILGAIGAVFGLFAMFGLLGLSALVGGFAGIFALAIIGLIVSEIGMILGGWGGYQMYQGNRDGKRLVIYGLVVYVIANLFGALGGAGSFIGWLFLTAIAFAVYYLVIISRFPGESPLVAEGTGPGPGPTSP
jgi:hypothetical protein